jgi:hypothetical protein
LRTTALTVQKLHDLERKINTCLEKYSAKDWNYSRLSVQVIPLQAIEGPFALVVETADLTTKQGRAELKLLQQEVDWGDRHSSELGFLELVSLRLNKALLAVGDRQQLEAAWPILRLAKRDDLVAKGETLALWYKVTEVSGEEFDSR